MEVATPTYSGNLRELLRSANSDRDVLHKFSLLPLVREFLVELQKKLSLFSAYSELLLICAVVELKSKLLLPPEEEVPAPVSQKADERTLSHRLRVYEDLRKSVSYLKERLEAQSKLLTPRGKTASAREVVYSLKDVSLYDLLSAFEEVLSRLEKIDVLDLSDEDCSFEEVYQEVLSQIGGSEAGLPLSSVLQLRPGLSWVIVSFLAILELITEETVGFRKEGGEFLLYRIPSEG